MMKEWISLIASIIALITAIVSLATSLRNAEKIASIVPCPVEVTINEPQTGDHVSAEFDVSGTSTIHDECKYVFIVVRGTSVIWEITDISQVDKRGQWLGKAQLNIPIGMETKIHALVSNRPDTYRSGQILSSPPVKGVSSNIIKVRRVQ